MHFYLQGGMQTRTLVYADLGPLSCERKPFSSASTCILDDHRIEYAQLNNQISAISQRTVQQATIRPEYSTGMHTCFTYTALLCCMDRVYIYTYYYTHGYVW